MTTPKSTDPPRIDPVDLDLQVTTVRGDGELFLEYRLSSPSGVVEFRPATVRSAALQAPDSYRDRLHDRLEKLREGVLSTGEKILPEEIPRELERIGELLFERLFPSSLREAWDKLTDVRALQITSDEPWIPWEMVKAPRESFFCLRFRLGRCFPGIRPAERIRVKNLAVIEAAEVANWPCLPQAHSEVATLVALGRELGAEVRSLRNAVSRDVESLLREGGYQLVHFVGHGQDTDDPDDSQFLLTDGRSLRSGDLVGELVEKLQHDRPLVVLNACQVGRQNWSLTGLGGWAERWLRGCGAAAFLGPQWKIDDTRASEFVERFYDELREGQPLGEALREARQELRQTAPHDLTWLAYCLYAHPNAQVVFGEASFTESILPVAVRRPKLIRLDPSVGSVGPAAREAIRAGYELLQQGDNARAVTQLVKALELAPFDPQANLYLGIAKLRGKNPKNCDWSLILAVEKALLIAAKDGRTRADALYALAIVKREHYERNHRQQYRPTFAEIRQSLLKMGPLNLDRSILRRIRCSSESRQLLRFN
jgi:hypothetical protein